jgi:hypothetical protein
MDPPVPAQPIVSISSLCNINVTGQDPVANAENGVRNALDDLQATGVLQPKNRMDIGSHRRWTGQEMISIK